MSVSQQLDRLLVADVDAVDRDELAALVTAAATVRGWLDAFELRCVRRGRVLADQGRGEPPERLLGSVGGRSTRESATVTDRQSVADTMDDFEGSLADGAVSAGHLDAIADATRRLAPDQQAEFTSHEAMLLDHAHRDSVDVFARRCRELARHIAAATRSDIDELDRQRRNSRITRWSDKHDGMCHTNIVLDPLRDATFSAALRHAINRRRQLDGNSQTPWKQLEVDAFIDLITGATTVPAPAQSDTMSPVDDDDAAGTEVMIRRIDARIPEVSVLIDYQTLLADAHRAGICETDDGTPLPAATLRRLCCDAEIIPIILNGAGEVLDVARSKRSATPAQRRALRAMHRTCAFPGCTVPFNQTRAHHVTWWTRDHGPTNIDNLLPLCERDHHRVHEGQWTLTLTPDRTATWTRPDGTTHHTGTTINRAALPGTQLNDRPAA